MSLLPLTAPSPSEKVHELFDEVVQPLLDNDVRTQQRLDTFQQTRLDTMLKEKPGENYAIEVPMDVVADTMQQLDMQVEMVQAAREAFVPRTVETMVNNAAKTDVLKLADLNIVGPTLYPEGYFTIGVMLNVITQQLEITVKQLNVRVTIAQQMKANAQRKVEESSRVLELAKQSGNLARVKEIEETLRQEEDRVKEAQKTEKYVEEIHNDIANAAKTIDELREREHVVAPEPVKLLKRMCRGISKRLTRVFGRTRV